MLVFHALTFGVVCSVAIVPGTRLEMRLRGQKGPESLNHRPRQGLGMLCARTRESLKGCKQERG